MIIRSLTKFLAGLVPHTGHELSWTTKGEPPTELSVQCLTCGAVLFHMKVVDQEGDPPDPDEPE